MSNNILHQIRTPGGKRPHRGVTLVLFAFFLIVILSMVAFAVDLGHIMLVRTQLQVAADAAVIAAAKEMSESPNTVIDKAKEYGKYHIAGGKSVDILTEDIELGLWDTQTRKFTPTEEVGNAVRVTTRRNKQAGGEVPLFFARILKINSFEMKASAVAMATPRDIAFVVDLSGSMNDDTEPCWATKVINSTFASQGYSSIGSEQGIKVFQDFNFGSFPGKVEYIGERFGAPKNNKAYAELTKHDGLLSSKKIPSKYRILPEDSELTRKKKAYSAIIDYQLAAIMPNAKPVPNSDANYAYWEKYLDYIIQPIKILEPKPKPTPTPTPKDPTPKPTPTPTPKPPSYKPPPIGCMEAPNYQYGVYTDLQIASSPIALQNRMLLLLSCLGKTTAPAIDNKNRGWLPPKQDGDRITSFNNPNRTAFPKAKSSVVRGYRNQLGYVTYLQFMMDHGRDLKPDGSTYVPLSTRSPDCPEHSEKTAGGNFDFPPRSQPVHAARRALIAAMQIVKEKNLPVGDDSQKDWVSVISFDRLTNGGPIVKQSLTAEYKEAMEACTRLQAAGDKGASTATDAGLITAKKHIRSKDEGGEGRKGADKIVVLLTDGAPNAFASNPGDVADYINNSNSQDFYPSGDTWHNAPLTLAGQMNDEHWMVFPVGVGLGTDYKFMDSMSRIGGSADENGEGPRGSGNPAEYEKRLTDIFRKIITNPEVRLVQ